MSILVRSATGVLILATFAATACTPPGYVYEVGNFVRPHPTHALCASRGQVLDMSVEDCVSPTPQSAPVMAAAAFNNQGETYESDRAWGARIERGACSRLRDRRTDSPADIAECRRDNAAQPLCMSYKGFAYAWFELADNPIPGTDTLTFQRNVINTLGPTTANPDTPPYYASPQYRDMLHRLLNFTLSPARKKWTTREQFADFAYRGCMEGRPL